MPLLASAEKPAAAARRRVDLAIGIPLGLVLGVAIVAAFIFLGSEGSVDAPRLSGVSVGKPVPVRNEGQRLGYGRRAP
jgi:hypothetical protein